MTPRFERNQVAQTGFRAPRSEGYKGSGRAAYERSFGPVRQRHDQNSGPSTRLYDLTPDQYRRDLPPHDNMTAAVDGTNPRRLPVHHGPSISPDELPPLTVEPVYDNMLARPKQVSPEIAALQNKLDTDVLNHQVSRVRRKEATISEAATAIGKSPADVALAYFVEEAKHTQTQDTVTVANNTGTPLPRGLEGVVEVAVDETKPDTKPDVLRAAFSSEYDGDPHNALAAAAEKAKFGVVMDGLPADLQLPSKLEGLDIVVFEQFNDRSIVAVDKRAKELVPAR